MNVLVAVDMGPGSHKVLAFGAELAKQSGGEVYVVHVITEEEEGRHKAGSSITALGRTINPITEIHKVAVEDDSEQSQYVDVMLTKTRMDLVDSLVELGVEPSSITAIARAGNVVDEIQRVAAEADVGALVIGMRHRSRVGKFLLGSDLQELLLSSTRPVVAVPIDPLSESALPERT